jgi:hypothetical protein
MLSGIKIYNVLEYSDRKRLTKNNFSINLLDEEKNLFIEDIDLYRSYLQIELLDTLYQFNATANQERQVSSIIELIDSLRNQFNFVAIEVKLIKEYTYRLALTGFDELFIKELTQLLIEKITGVNENPRSINPAINNEFEKYLVNNLKQINYSDLYVYRENKTQSLENQGFYSLSHIRKTIINIKKEHLPIDTCSNYNAFISDIPSS